MLPSSQKMARCLSGINSSYASLLVQLASAVSNVQLRLSRTFLAFSCCRNARRESMKQLDKHEKDGDLSEDEKKALADTVQELTDDYVKQIETLAKAKQDELIKI